MTSNVCVLRTYMMNGFCSTRVFLHLFLLPCLMLGLCVCVRVCDIYY